MIALAALVACSGPHEGAPDTDVPTADTGPAPWTGPPNLLVFLVDDMGPERFDLYDLAAPAARTPVIDAVAEAGVVFDRAYATPLCSSTRAALLTGRLAFRNGIGAAIPQFSGIELPASELTIPEALAASDTPWSTAAFGKWHLAAQNAPDVATHPNRQGFAHFEGVISNPASYHAWNDVIDGVTVGTGVYHTQRMTIAAVQWLDTAPEPWFVYVPLLAAHAPWHAPPDFWTYEPVDSQATDSRKADAMLESADRSIGLTLGSLPPEVLEHTIVVILGDNGTAREVADPPNTYEAAKGSFDEGGIRVPMIIAGAGISPGRTEALASVHDVWPTLFELAGEPMPTDRVFDGTSLVPVLADPTARVRDLLYLDAHDGLPPAAVEQRGQVVISATHKLRIERGQLSLREVGAGNGFLDGPDLLPGPLSPADQAAYDVLFAEYQRMERATQEAWAALP
ncbi:MAG: sulfatase-like hydrolase/transferase [Myxococcota bacterium]